MGSIIDRALDIINDHLKDQTSSFQVSSLLSTARAMARGGHVLEDDYPTHYLPDVGRQVMARGGQPAAPLPPMPEDAPAPAPMGHNMPPEPMQPVGASMDMEGLHPQLISQRLPTAVKKQEDPNAQALLVGLDSAKMHPKSFEHNVNLVKTYDHLRPEETAGSHDEVAENFINHLKDNYLFLHDMMPEETRSRAKEWYVGANKFANDLAKKHGAEPAASAAAIAAMSPQKDWFQNASLAERLFDIHHNHADENYSHDMEMTANRIFGKEKFDSLLNELRGKAYGEIEDPRLKAIWARLYDETYHDPAHRLMTPEGVIGDWVKNQDGSRSRVSWGSTTEILKGIKALIGGATREKISDLMGERHKIRNFFNNILDPHSPTQDVTVDTHAVAGGLLEPLGANATQVSHNFKNNVQDGSPASKGSAETGVQGTYPFFAEAIRRAAAERGIEPREMQSITWEGLKGLFPDTLKTKENIASVRGIWKDYAAGNIDIDEARNRIVKLAGGMNEPAWSGSAPISDEGAPRSTYQRKLSKAGVYGGSSSVDAGAGGADTGAVPRLEEPELRGFQRNRELTRASRKAFGQEALPQSFSRRTGRVGKNNVATDFDAPVRAVYDPTPEAQEAFSSAGIAAPSMVELASGAKGAKAFHSAITESKKTNPLAASVYAYDPDEYKGMRLFMTPNGKAGFALKGDDIVSVFNSKDSGHTHVSNAMLQLAVAQGGRRLDAFDTALPHIYSRNKFRVASRMRWNDKYTPEGWNHSDFSAYKNGRPDVVYMHFDPTYDQLYDGSEGPVMPNDEMALKLQQAGVKKSEANIKKLSNKKTAKAFGGGITPFELGNNNLEDEARRLILWSYAAAPVVRPLSRKDGGKAYPVAMTKEAKGLKKKNGKLKKMKPQEFLNETDPLHIGKGDRKIIDTFKHNIKTGHHLGPLKIYDDGGQDGRHRANAAKELGIKAVPVIDYRKADGGPVDDAQNAVDLARNLTPMGFYSAAAEAASKIPQRAPIDQIMNKIKGQPNVKAAELDNANLADTFAGQKSVDPKEVARHLQASVPQLSEKVYGGKPPVKYSPKPLLYNPEDFEDADEVHRIGPEGQKPHYIVKEGSDYHVYGPSGYHQTYESFNDAVDHANNSINNVEQPLYKEYTIPGGKNYREVVMQLPEEKEAAAKKVTDFYNAMQEKYGDNFISKISPEEDVALYRLQAMADVAESKQPYRSSHWHGVSNPVAHLRMSDRDNGKTLHIEELQSDWGQEGRKKGFGQQVTLNPLEEMEYFNLHGMSGSDRTEEQQNRLDELTRKMDASKIKPVSPAPYVSDTNQWVDLGLKRALMEAAKGGYDKVVITPGEAQADRYDLSRRIKKIIYDPDDKTLSYMEHGIPGYETMDNIPGNVEPHEIENHIGKEAASKLLATEPHKLSGNHILEGEDLKVGGKGMNDFYDKLVPQRLNKLIAQHDPSAKVAMRSYPLSYKVGTGRTEDIDWHGNPVEEMETKKVNGHILHITPKLRAAILKGLPAFKAGGDVGKSPIIDRAFKVLSKFSR